MLIPGKNGMEYLYIAVCILFVRWGTWNFFKSVYNFQLYYLRLPKDIKDYKVILMDATVATGAAAMMAIRVLLDHDVPEENILIVSLLMAEIGKQDIERC
jgi:uracil phosphoribosyltransferase